MYGNSVRREGLADGLNHSQKDRLVYKFDDTRIYIFAIGGHFDSFEPKRQAQPSER
jgi:hypothetical protein